MLTDFQYPEVFWQECTQPHPACDTVALKLANIELGIEDQQRFNFRWLQRKEWLLQIVGTGARDSEAKVRGQAMFALGELAGNCQPEMSAHAREALPCVFAAMAEDNPTLQQQACYALDSFCEHLGVHFPDTYLVSYNPHLWECFLFRRTTVKFEKASSQAGDLRVRQP